MDRRKAKTRWHLLEALRLLRNEQESPLLSGGVVTPGHQSTVEHIQLALLLMTGSDTIVGDSADARSPFLR